MNFFVQCSSVAKTNEWRDARLFLFVASVFFLKFKFRHLYTRRPKGDERRKKKNKKKMTNEHSLGRGAIGVVDYAVRVAGAVFVENLLSFVLQLLT